MLAKVTPVQKLSTSYLNDPFDRIFDDVLSTWSIFDRIPNQAANHSYVIEEIDGKLKCEIDMLGLKPGDIKLQAEQGYIVIAGSRRGKEFRWRLAINDRYDTDSTIATMDSGVLTLTLSARAQPEVRLIPINAGE